MVDILFVHVYLFIIYLTLKTVIQWKKHPFVGDFKGSEKTYIPV